MVKRSLLSRVRARRQRRGASVLIVFLVLTMLTGIGIYAARSATLSTAMAGSSKQLSQTRHVSEYAIMNAAASLANDPQRYLAKLPSYTPAAGDNKCLCLTGADAIPNATCLPVGLEQLKNEAGVDLLLPADKLAKIPGALGPASIQVDFNIDISDLQPAAPPVPGDPLNPRSPGGLSYFSLTLTATGQLRPESANAAALAQNLASVASNSRWRAHVTVGPLPNPAARPAAP